MRGRQVHARFAAGTLALAALALAGCGGGERQDADEPSGTFTVDVVRASFPAQQRLAQQSQLRIAVRNGGQKAVPNVAVTVESGHVGAPASPFAEASSQQDLANPSRPVWIVDAAPRGGDTAYTNTWALGRLAAGQTKTFVWNVTAVKPGVHTIKYRVAAGLDGKAKARAADGQEPHGTFTIDISGRPANQRVAPSGAVEDVP